MIGLLKKLFGDKSQRDIKGITPLVEQTKTEFSKLAGISDDELRNLTFELKNKINAYVEQEEKQIEELKAKAASSDTPVLEKEELFEQIDSLTDTIDEKIEEVLMEILPQAFAVVKETARRLSENGGLKVKAQEFDHELAASNDFVEIQGDQAVWSNQWTAGGNLITWNMVHYDVQLIGGIALHQGKVAEMQTGEGKTLVATLPVFLNALTGKGVHLVTVNDYLAKRDSEWMGPLFQFHGLSIRCIDRYQPNSEERREAYKADIIYGTNNEYGFDYLRDNMAVSPEMLVQQKHHFAIVDEVDSVLIDDARTPLIISGPTPGGDKHEFFELRPKIEALFAEQRKIVNGFLTDAKSKLKDIDGGDIPKDQLKSGGDALLRAFRGLPKTKPLIKFLSEPGVRAHLQKTENYYLQDQGKEMPVIDAELFFVIDEKNNSIELTDKGIELISKNEDPDFYILPDLSIMLSDLEKSEGTDEEKLEKREAITRDYSVKADRIHSMNQLLKAYTLFEKDVEYVVLDNKVKIVDEQTGRIMDGRRFSDGLHQALEAKENVKVEAATQTYATITLQNYFRMYHKLSGMTGTAETEAGELWDIYELDVVMIPTNRPIARKDEEDLVFKTVKEKFNAIIEEVVKLQQQGRPVLVGTTAVDVSELLSRMLKLRGIKHNVLNAKLHQKEADIVAEAGKPGMVTIATNMAGRGTDIKLGEGVHEAGGLAIIGTERHDSRRVDRQLRGRAGRQGDPGSSQFFVSLEDNLMRLFGSERIAKIMDRLGLKEGEVIQHSMITKSIERAQKKVEENNFGIRKRLLEYDDVMNAQREVIYKRRKNALYGERLSIDISNMFYDACESVVVENKNRSDYMNFKLDVLKHFASEVAITEEEFKAGKADDLTDQLVNQVYGNYKRKAVQIAEQAFPVIKNVYETQGERYERITVPFTDGTKMVQLAADLKKSYDTQGTEVLLALEKGITLSLIDNEWKEHLRSMDDLRTSVQMAVHEQKDPLLIYKFESFELFKVMITEISKEIISFLVRAQIAVQEGAPAQQAPPEPRQDMSKLQTSRPGSEGEAAGQAQQQSQRPQRVAPVVREEKKVGRNDRVKIVNMGTREIKEVKYKQAEPLLSTGQWQLIEE